MPKYLAIVHADFHAILSREEFEAFDEAEAWLRKQFDPVAWGENLSQRFHALFLVRKQVEGRKWETVMSLSPMGLR